MDVAMLEQLRARMLKVGWPRQRLATANCSFLPRAVEALEGLGIMLFNWTDRRGNGLVRGGGHAPEGGGLACQARCGLSP